jgi:hypothetical protein
LCLKNEKPHTGRIGLFAKHSLTKIFDSIIEMNENKKRRQNIVLLKTYYFTIFISFIFENGIIMDRAAWHTTGKIKCFCKKILEVNEVLA